MGRRNKEELIESNYYEWLKDKEALQKKKKSGVKLTPAEKAVVRTVPTPEQPYAPTGKAKETSQTKESRRPKDLKTITWGKEKEFQVKGGFFLCEVKNAPYDDTECVLFCEREDCPFFQQGYLKVKGLR